MTGTASELGTILKSLRTSRGWTLARMSQEVGIALSTLSKVERGQLTLNYDKIQQIAQHLKVPLSELFSSPEEEKAQRPTGLARRSISSIENAMLVETDKYDYYYLSCDLRKKLMIPMITRVKARTIEEFGDLLVHDGEEFVYIIQGSIKVVTEHYSPVILETGESIYIDSNMGHAYLLADGCDEAALLGIASTGSDADDIILPEPISQND